MKGNKAKIVCAASEKGGVAKSTTIHVLGAALVKEGKKVLFIDLDTQRNLSFVMNASGEYMSIYDVLNGADINKAIQETGKGDLIKGDLRTSSLEDLPVNALKDALSKLKKEYDYIVIDTPPGVKRVPVNALMCADEVIVPCTPGIFSLQSLMTELDLIQDIQKKYNKNLNVNGVLVTMYNKRIVMHRQIREAIEDQAKKRGIKVYSTPIRINAAIGNAQGYRESVIEYDSRSNGAEDYSQFIKEYKENEQQERKTK